MEEQTLVEKKRWWLAGIFSFVIPGLGQIYNSEAIKGLIFYLLIFICNIIFYTSIEHPKLLTRPLVLSLLLVYFIMLLIYFFTIIDAIRSAIKARTGRKLKFYNRWSVYLLILLVFCGFNFLMPDTSSSFDKIKAFKIPSRSMQSTIEAGDYVICNLFYYRSHNPERGDIIVFKYPRDEKLDYIKRIIGLPGEMIELKQHTLFVNGKKVDEPYAVYNGAGNGPAQIPENYGPYFISDNEYFVMGDNRNNSSDSRVFGTVDRRLIEGKALFVYFSWNMDIPLWNIPDRLASIRFSRIGDIL